MKALTVCLSAAAFISTSTFVNNTLEKSSIAKPINFIAIPINKYENVLASSRRVPPAPELIASSRRVPPAPELIASSRRVPPAPELIASSRRVPPAPELIASSRRVPPAFKTPSNHLLS